VAHFSVNNTFFVALKLVKNNHEQGFLDNNKIV
jgi:hypothetical protein